MFEGFGRGRIAAVQSWNLLELETPEGSRSPIVLHSTEDARAVLIGLNHADRSPGIAGDGLQVPDVVAPQTDPRVSGFTPPIGTDKGSLTPRSTP